MSLGHIILLSYILQSLQFMHIFIPTKVHYCHIIFFMRSTDNICFKITSIKITTNQPTKQPNSFYNTLHPNDFKYHHAVVDFNKWGRVSGNALSFKYFFFSKCMEN